MKKILLILSLTILSIVGYSQSAKTTPVITSAITDEYLVFIPNAFTPNNDGLNDIFTPSVIGSQNFEMTIFDRWSEVLYHTDDLSKGWDGTYKGHPCKENVYIWKIVITDIFNIKHQYIGHLTIVK